jgi:hypothetical protein
VRNLSAPHPSPRAAEVPEPAVLGTGADDAGVGEDTAADEDAVPRSVAPIALDDDRPRAAAQRMPTIPFVDSMSFGAS